MVCSKHPNETATTKAEDSPTLDKEPNTRQLWRSSQTRVQTSLGLIVRIKIIVSPPFKNTKTKQNKTKTNKQKTGEARIACQWFLTSNCNLCWACFCFHGCSRTLSNRREHKRKHFFSKKQGFVSDTELKNEATIHKGWNNYCWFLELPQWILTVSWIGRPQLAEVSQRKQRCAMETCDHIHVRDRIKSTSTPTGDKISTIYNELDWVKTTTNCMQLNRQNFKQRWVQDICLVRTDIIAVVLKWSHFKGCWRNWTGTRKLKHRKFLLKRFSWRKHKFMIVYCGHVSRTQI